MLSQPSFSPPLIIEDLPAGPQLVFTLNNRFFRHQACYSLLPAKTGEQADRVISLCKYKVVEGHTRWRERGWVSPSSDEVTYTVVLFKYTLWACGPGRAAIQLYSYTTIRQVWNILEQ
jgi:hypothetical protein